MQTAIVWLRNDLRLTDNRTLTEALKLYNWIIPVYIFDPRHYRTSTYGFAKIGPYRANFIVACVQAMRHELQSLGSNLIVRQGNASTQLKQLCKEYGVSAVYYSKEVAPEENKEEQELTDALQELGIQTCVFENTLLLQQDKLPFELGAMPDVFTQFRVQVEQLHIYGNPLPKPSQIYTPLGIPEGLIPCEEPYFYNNIQLHTNASFHFKGGEQNAFNHLNDYVWEKNGAAHYFETRNQLWGDDYSTKLSVWLAQGALSARSVFATIKEYEVCRVANKSTYWIGFELLWRDFFRLTMEKYKSNLFFIKGPKRRDISYEWNPEIFWTWVNGQTKDDFINACMNELRCTGYLSNRGRQVCASYLVHDLNSNWLMGAAYFESMLIDYDVASNYGNWAYIAGVGNDPRVDRVFNVAKQAAAYDPDGAYRKLWANKSNANVEGDQGTNDHSKETLQA